MVAPTMCNTSNTSIVTQVNSHETLMKLTTMANVLWPTQNIQKSNDVIYVTRATIEGKM